MLLNSIEKKMMNNPIRASIQRHFEAKRLLSMGGPMNGGIALEIGCGRGIGSEIILNKFMADKIDAFDLDPSMVNMARKRLKPYGDKITIYQGDATQIPVENNYYDAVFDFGIIHHIPNWRDAVSEIHRVLKPDGKFYCEEVLKKFICHPVWQFLLKHPQNDRFTFDTFMECLHDNGFSVTTSNQLFEQFGWFFALKK